MELAAISLENYKTFPGRESILIRPLTVFVGRNSSGKSVLARSPLLISRGLSDRAEAPIDLAFDNLDFGASFVDLIHNRSPHGSITIGAKFATEDDRTVEFHSKIQHFDEYRFQLVSRFSLKQTNKPDFTITWIGNNPLKDGERYRIEETQQECRVSFRGLFPQTIQSSSENEDVGSRILKLNDDLAQIRDDISSTMTRVTYLGPFREPPERFYRFPSGIPRGVGPRGKQAPALLGDDFVRQRGMVLGAVGRWFAEHLGGWPLALSKVEDTFSLVLQNPKNPNVTINIVDVGTGISQILPIVVQRHFESVAEIRGRIEIVEQPELHLHPGAHGSVADLFVEAANKLSARFIIETHSENFLLRIRRSVAEGKLDAHDVIIYWVNDDPESAHQVQPIYVNEDGSVDTWPTGVFAEDFEEVRAIRKAQKKLLP